MCAIPKNWFTDEIFFFFFFRAGINRCDYDNRLILSNYIQTRRRNYQVLPLGVRFCWDSMIYIASRPDLIPLINRSQSITTQRRNHSDDRQVPCLICFIFQAAFYTKSTPRSLPRLNRRYFLRSLPFHRRIRLHTSTLARLKYSPLEESINRGNNCRYRFPINVSRNQRVFFSLFPFSLLLLRNVRSSYNFINLPHSIQDSRIKIGQHVTFPRAAILFVETYCEKWTTDDHR